MAIVNSEVYNFIRTEKMNKDNVKVLEQRIEDKLSKVAGSNLQKSGLQQLQSSQLIRNNSKQYLS